MMQDGDHVPAESAPEANLSEKAALVDGRASPNLQSTTWAGAGRLQDLQQQETRAPVKPTGYREARDQGSLNSLDLEP